MSKTKIKFSKLDKESREFLISNVKKAEALRKSVNKRLAEVERDQKEFKENVYNLLKEKQLV